MTNSIKKILYIQHASSLGGSCMSLLYTMQNLNRNQYQPILALTNKSKIVIDFYEKAGFRPLICPEINFWNHTTATNCSLHKITTWVNLIKITLSWEKSQKKILELVKSVNPDIVHLNSVVLSSSASILIKKNIPFVWHIREHPPKEFLKFRTNIIKRLMLSCVDKLIFISNADRKAWINDVKAKIIPNFIDFNQFNLPLNKTKTRKEMSIPTNASVILYVGRLSKLKGIFPLIRALNTLKKKLPQLYCLMPGSEYNPPNSWKLNLARTILPLIGYGTTGQYAIKKIKRLGLEKTCLLLPFQENIKKFIAVCDVLVFPSIRPHFARPIIEASAMKKPVIASKFDCMEELVQNNETGLLVEPNSPKLLAEALYDILSNPKKAKRMGEAGYVHAKEKFSAKENCGEIMKIYDKVLKNISKNTMPKINSIAVGKYHLEPLLSIRQDDISGLLGIGPGVYICDCPEAEWYRHFGFKEKQRIGIVRKKRRMFLQMGKNSKWISPTSDVPNGKHTVMWKNKNILHLGYRGHLPLRISQILQTISLFKYLWQHKQEYEYCLVYNFYLPFYLAPLAIKILFKKKLYIDYEDDYTLQRKNWLKNYSEYLLRKTVNGAICVNKNMLSYFKKTPTRIFNGFANLEYTKHANFSLSDGMNFLFSGTLDKIRGVELIPELIVALRERIKNFKIFITGSGPLQSIVEGWDCSEIKYLGFLDNLNYQNIIKKADACLVLQKPDTLLIWGLSLQKLTNMLILKKTFSY